MRVEEGDPETGRTAHGPERAGEPCMPVKRVSKHAPGSMFCSAIIVLSDSAGSPVFSRPLLFLQEDRRRTQDTWSHAVRAGGSRT